MAKFGMQTLMGERAVRELVDDVLRNPDFTMAGEQLRLGLSFIHIDHPEVENLTIRQAIHRETGKRWPHHLDILE